MNYHIIVIGAGGTGGALLPKLCQFLSTSNNIDYMLTVVDGDTVEKKNLERQPFLISDINENKAESMAIALSETFGIDVYTYPQYINEVQQMKDIFKNSYETRKLKLNLDCNVKDSIPVVFGCVDNHAARMVLEDFFSASESCFYFDCANEFSYGEVVFSIKAKNKVFSPLRSFYFPELKEETHISRSEESCEALNNSSPQHLATNVLSANIAFTAFADLISKNIVPSGIVHFDTFRFFMRHDSYQEQGEKVGTHE